ncbi:MAG: hypothetical protein WCE51_13645 [Chthoniobacterales bacterium]
MRQGRGVRWLFLLPCLTTTCVGFAHAQQPEGKFVDRLLRPDMSLVNLAQNKKFIAADGTAVDKKFEAKSFYSGNEQPIKSFWGVRNFFAKEFGTKKFSRGETRARAVARTELAHTNLQAFAKASLLIRAASEEGKVAATQGYADTRPFLGKGTRQEILSRQDRPLTIDQVRELLNRNK